jgi:arginase
MEKKIGIIEAPLSTGVGLAGVELMATSLREAGLQSAVGALSCESISEPLLVTSVDPDTSLPDPQVVRKFLLDLADRVAESCRTDHTPLVVGGDCTILLGCLAGAKRHGDLGLLFIDAQTDFHPPGRGKTETASMELYLATGRGPEVLSNLEGDVPLIADCNVVCLGYRTGERPYTGTDGAQMALSPLDTDIVCLPLDHIRKRGFGNTLDRALKHLCADGREFWLHFDVDALHDDVMPAVDYRLPDGLSVGEIVEAIRRAMNTGRVRGVNVTIYNPTLDWDGSQAKLLVDLLGAALNDE